MISLTHDADTCPADEIGEEVDEIAPAEGDNEGSKKTRGAEAHQQHAMMGRFGCGELLGGLNVSNDQKRSSQPALPPYSRKPLHMHHSSRF
ncbi:MAG: hypothetical protein WCB79_06630 [Halobacteriota archaeon]